VALGSLAALAAATAWAAAGPFGAPGAPTPERSTLVAQDAPEPDFQRAATLYNTTCVACHGPYGSGAAMPGLGIPPLDAQGTAWQKSAIDLQFIIKGGKGSMPGVGGSWSKQDVLDVLALMRTWWTPAQQKQHDALSGTSTP
jgi:mono/diheme cytochrome c family protein